MNKKAYLILEDGTNFEGYSFGADGEVIGEVIFATNMTGFSESITDPDYKGRILVQTFPIIGNTGTNKEDLLSENSGASAVVVREHCELPSNFRSEGTLNELMKRRGIVGLQGIDTRRLTRILREKGTMNGIISNKPDADLNAVKAHKPDTSVIIKRRGCGRSCKLAPFCK